jgi:tetratricopeptide (TPR) repeat protein
VFYAHYDGQPATPWEWEGDSPFTPVIREVDGEPRGKSRHAENRISLRFLNQKANGSVLNTYLYLGEYDKFIASLPEVNDSAFLLFYRGFGEYHQKNWDRAAKDFDRAFDLDPYLYTQIGKALSDSIVHRNVDGLEILQVVEKKIGERGVGDPEGTYKVAQAYSILGDKVAALRVLRSSVRGGFFPYPYLVRDPSLNPLRQEPEFAEILNLSNRRYQAFRKKFFWNTDTLANSASAC